MQMTRELLSQAAPNLPEEERLLYALKLGDPTRLIAGSPLELIRVQTTALVRTDGAADRQTANKSGGAFLLF